MKNELVAILKDFPKINLDQLNASAKFMERMENKYIVDNDQLQQFFKKAHKKYYILQIKENVVFSYQNVYMDTKDYFFYHEHEHKKNKRVKLRTRQYVDSNIAFFEYKQREGDLVRKFRYQCPVIEHGKMTKDAERFYAELVTQFNKDYTKSAITPAISTNYKRITLCSKNSDERVTIDFNLELGDLRDPKSKIKKFNHFAIIENKSSHKKATSHHILKELGIKPAKSCSKYCLGVYYFNKAASRKTFEKTVKHIENMKKKKPPTVKKATKKLPVKKLEIK